MLDVAAASGPAQTLEADAGQRPIAASHAWYIGAFAVLGPALHLALGLLVDAVLGAPFGHFGRAAAPLGVGLLLAGATIIALATGWLRVRGGGLPISSAAPGSLVRTGPYRYSRHPIYLGATLAFAGVACLLGSRFSALVCAPMLAFFYACYASGVEEPVLGRRFGAPYGDYQATTPFLGPFVLRRPLARLIEAALAGLSVRVNRPGLRWYGQHALFWGYAAWPGLGVAIGLMLSAVLLSGAGLTAGEVSAAIVVTTLASLAGTRLVYRIAAAIKDRVRLTSTRGAVGFVSWGVPLALFTTLPLLAWLIGRPAWVLLDATLPVLMVTHVFGRIGCTFYGCCHGKPTGSRLCLSYRHPALKPVRLGVEGAQALRPSQPISAACGLFASALVFGLWSAHPLPALLPSALVAVLYGLLRIGEEWLRYQSYTLGPWLSPAQVGALALALCGLGVMAWQLSHGHAVHPQLGSLVLLGAPQAVLLAALPLAGGLLTFAVFGYHRGRVGRWT